MINALEEIALSVTTKYVVKPGNEFVVALGSTATIQYWDGAAYVDYPPATPGGATQDKMFVFIAPPSGKIQITVASGSPVVCFQPTPE